MTSTLRSIGSIALIEWKLRFRRTSTWVLFLLLCIAAFLLMPDVGTNSVMFLIGQRRALLNSAATSLTSALMGGFVLSLFGFYFISDSVTRDLRSGVGRLIGPSPVASAQYLVGKFLGNTVFLYALSFIFMIACMLVHALRGEAPLEPMVFATTFGVMFLPMGPAVAGLALTFECVPFLSGRVGDVLYFFSWVLLLTLPVALLSSGNGPGWLLGFDLTGIGFFIPNIIHVTGSTNFTIGYAPYDATLAPVVFQGLDFNPVYVVPRMFSAFMAVPFVGLALAAFRRFDPAAGKSASGRSGTLYHRARTLTTNWLHGLVPPVRSLGGPPGMTKAVILDAHLTFALTPVLVLAIIAISLGGILAPLTIVRTTILPLAFFVFVPAVSSVATRDRSANVSQLIFSAPLVRQHMVIMKFLSALSVLVVLTIVPLLRVSIADPFSGVALLNGLIFVAAAATFLGLLTGTPKAFTVVFLLFLYLAMSSRAEPAFDFAGWGGIVTPGIFVGYAAVSLLMIIVTTIRKRWRGIDGV